MKALKSYLIFGLVLLVLSGCSMFRNPLSSWNSANKKVDSIEQKVQVNEDKTVNQAKQYVFAADLTLRSDPNPNKFNFLAQDFTGKTITTLGQPTMEETIMLRKMVSDLLSTNQQIIAKGQKNLAALDKQLIELQEENVNLQTSLVQAQTKLETVGTANAGLAQKWATLLKFFWGAVYLVIGIFVLKIISAVLPPPWNSIVGLAAVIPAFFIKVVGSLIPEAKTMAGVVSKNYKTSTEDLVTVIQKLKESHPELHTEISEKVYSNTDSDTSAVAINEAKKTLNIVS